MGKAAAHLSWLQAHGRAVAYYQCQAAICGVYCWFQAAADAVSDQVHEVASPLFLMLSLHVLCRWTD